VIEVSVERYGITPTVTILADVTDAGGREL
jgi:hypothetical protein